MAIEPATERCNLCWGRGYRPEARKSGRGLYLRTCRRCGGSGSVQIGTRNPE
jgi:DnaJ-class molecular chaperone